MSVVIEVEHVTKEFELGQLGSLSRSLRNALLRWRGRQSEIRRPFKALDDVSFKVEQGEVLGIIGHNGAGKSTLLKLLAGITQPTNGRVQVHGRVAPLIEVGAGLVPDMTGRENIFLNGAILGMSRAEVKRKFEDIVEFSELEEFIDTPVKRYSSGMQIKLGFAIATSVNADILIVDEVLAVGDLAFQRKSFDRMESLIRHRQRAVLLVSHNIRQVERICSRAVLLDHGRLMQDGLPSEVGNAFYELSDRAIASQRAGGIGGLSATEWPDIELLEISFDSPEQRRGDWYAVHDEPLVVTCRFKAARSIKDPTFGLGIHTTDLLYICNADTDMKFRPGIAPEGELLLRWRIGSMPLLPGVYALRLSIFSGETAVFSAENLVQFRVVGSALSRARAGEMGFIPLNATTELICNNSISCAADVADAHTR